MRGITYKQFSVRFHTENDDFFHNPEMAIADILEDIAGMVRQGITNGSVSDTNGNVIGRFGPTKTTV